MSEMFVMRRADGEPFSEEIKGVLRIPVWSSEAGPARYRERNPELITFLPAPLTRSFINRIGGGASADRAPGFFLLAEDDPDADLDEGRPISLEELLPGSERVRNPAQLQH